MGNICCIYYIIIYERIINIERVDGKLYEVKGDQFFDGDKMINPYDRSQDGLYEAKHQCMIKNNIIILKENDIKIASYTK